MKDKYKNFKEKWADPKEHAKMSFAFYGLFFLVVFVLMIIANKIQQETLTNGGVTPNSVIEQTLSVFEMQQELIKNKYEFNYKITIDGNQTILYGTNNLGDINGYKETKDSIIKYKVIDNIVYKSNLDEDVVINDLYDGIKIEYIFPEKLFEITSSMTLIKKNSDDKRVFTYMQDGLEVEIICLDNSIKMINIKDNENTYNLEYN